MTERHPGLATVCGLWGGGFVLHGVRTYHSPHGLAAAVVFVLAGLLLLYAARGFVARGEKHSG